MGLKYRFTNYIEVVKTIPGAKAWKESGMLFGKTERGWQWIYGR